METPAAQAAMAALPGPHSLGKLIEWKPLHNGRPVQDHVGPHSLGKLIEWKLSTAIMLILRYHVSPLAGETN